MTTIDRIVLQPTRIAKKGGGENKAAQQAQPEARFAGQTPASTGKSKLATGALLAASLGGIFAPSPAKAEVSPTSGKVVQWVNKAVQNSEGKQKDWKEFTINNWNDVRVGLRVTDDIRELDLNPLREQLLREGARNPDIRFHVIHEAVHTAGNLGAALQDGDVEKSPAYKGQNLTAEDIRGQLAQVLLPYRDRVLVTVREVKDDQVKFKRYFVPAEMLDGVDMEHPDLKAIDLRSVADNALAKLGHKATLDNMSKQLMDAGTNNAKRNEMFDVLRQVSPTLQQPEVTGKVLEWVYGSSDPINNPSGKPGKASAKPAAPVNPPAKPSAAGAPVVKHDEYDEDDGEGLSGFLPGFFGDDSSTNGMNNVPSDLNKPNMVEITSTNRVQIAKSIQYLAERDHDLALPAATQWFLKRGYTHNTRDISLDMLVLKGLAKKAQTDEKAFAVLKMVTTTHPLIVGNAFLSSQQLSGTIDGVKAGDEVAAAFKKHPVAAHGLILDMFNRQGQILWKDPKSDSDKQSLHDTRELGRRLALIVMVSDHRGTFAEQLRPLPENRFEDEFARQAGIIGLALSRDHASIDTMMRVATNPQEDDWLKALALQAALVTDTPHDMVPEVMARSYAERPFSMGMGKFLVDQDLKTGELKFKPKANPFQAKIQQRYEKMLKQAQIDQEQATKSGRLANPITNELKLDMLQKAIHAEFGGAQGSHLLSKGKDGAFQSRYLAPLNDYLKKGDLDPEMAIPAMAVLGKTGYEPAADTLHKIVIDPAKYLVETEDDSFFALMFKAILPAIVRINAAEALGGTVNPGDVKGDALHSLLKDPLINYQFAALSGLEAMGKRGADTLKTMADTKTRADMTPDQLAKFEAKENALKSGLDSHATRTIDYLKRVQSGMHDIQQRRRVRDFLSYQAARTADTLGGTAALVKYADEVKQKDPKAGIIRSVGQAILSNKYSKDGLEFRAYDDEAVKTFNEKGYWGVDNLHKMGASGKGGEHAHFDVGYINPVTKDLKDAVSYPNWMRWNDENNWYEPHPTGTAETVRLVAPGVKIYDYNIAETLVPDIYATDAANDALNVGLEDLLQRQMLPVGDPNRTQVTTTNHSYGYTNAVMYLKPLREQVIDLTSAYLEALGQTGVTNFISAGNSQASGPMGSYDPVGSVNTLGSRTDKNGKVTKSESTVLVAAVDGFQKWLAEFSSMPNPLRLDEALEMMGAPGYQEMTLYKNDLGIWERIPVDGTSFSSPNLAGAAQLANVGQKNPNLAMLVKVADKAREQAGLMPWTQADKQAALRAASEPLPGREKWETGLYVDPLKFLIEAVKKSDVSAPVEKAEAKPAQPEQAPKAAETPVEQK